MAEGDGHGDEVEEVDLEAGSSTRRPSTRFRDERAEDEQHRTKAMLARMKTR